MKIKKGDNVKIISGKDRGKIAKVIRVSPDEERIVVEGVNMRKKHRRPRQDGKKGEIIHIAGTMHVSNVMIVCSKCGKPARIGYRVEGDTKQRICKKCGSDL